MEFLDIGTRFIFTKDFFTKDYITEIKGYKKGTKCNTLKIRKGDMFMKINNKSICNSCKYFEHECGIPCGDDYICFEYCKCNNETTVDNFYDNEIIERCSCFENL